MFAQTYLQLIWSLGNFPYQIPLWQCFQTQTTNWMVTLEFSLTMCPVRKPVWAEWYLSLVICNKKPVFTLLSMHRLLGPVVRLSPPTRESWVQIQTLATLWIYIYFFLFVLLFFLPNPWALERFCNFHGNLMGIYHKQTAQTPNGWPFYLFDNFGEINDLILSRLWLFVNVLCDSVDL